ncbi:MAG: DUF481 domain-containing protein [Cyclobacteriaceae bacterium]
MNPTRKKLPAVLLVLLLLTISNTAIAQILKVDRRSVLKDTSDYWYGNVDFKLNINNNNATPEQNLTFVGFNGSLDVNYASKKHLYMLINNINYFTTGVGPFVSNGHVHFRTNWLRKRKLSYENYAQIQYDRGRNLQRRALVGGGIKINFFQRDKSYFHAGTGVMYESELWKQFDGDITTVNLYKSSNYLGGVFEVSEHLNINLTYYYQTGYSEEFGKFLHRVSGDFNLLLKINEKLQYVTSFRIRYESQPIIPINNVVYLLENGLKIRLGR